MQKVWLHISVIIYSGCHLDILMCLLYVSEKPLRNIRNCLCGGNTDSSRIVGRSDEPGVEAHQLSRPPARCSGGRALTTADRPCAIVAGWLTPDRLCWGGGGCNIVKVGYVVTGRVPALRREWTGGVRCHSGSSLHGRTPLSFFFSHFRRGLPKLRGRMNVFSRDVHRISPNHIHPDYLNRNNKKKLQVLTALMHFTTDVH